MKQPHVWAIESRSKRGAGSGNWTPERCDCGWGALARIRGLLGDYRAVNPRHEWRLVKYVRAT